MDNQALNFKQSMKRSTFALKNEVIPALKKKYPNSEFLIVENQDNKVLDALDIYGGIDIIVKNKENDLFGIASRIQHDYDYKTFTVRKERDNGKKTEFEKRLKQMDKNALTTFFVIQAYIINDKLKRYAIMKQKDLIDYINKYNPPITHTKSKQYGQASFFICDWNDIKRKGYNIYGEEFEIA